MRLPNVLPSERPFAIERWTWRILARLGRRKIPLARHVTAWMITVVAMLSALPLRGQNVQAPVVPENHPMLVAAREGNKETVLRFLDDGTSINSCNKWGHTVVSLALERRDASFGRELLARKFDPKLSFKSANTGEEMQIGIWPLTQAVKDDVSDVVSTLLARGVEPYSQFYAHKDMVFQAAVGHRRIKILELLLEHVKNRDARAHVAENSFSYLVLAMNAKSVEVIEVLARHGLDVNARSIFTPMPTALHSYARTHWAEGITKLLELGADPACSDGLGATPGSVATKPEIKQLFALAEAKAQTKAEGRSLPLGRQVARPPRFAMEVFQMAMASEEDAIAASRQLSPAELQAKDNRGWTLLTYALQNKRLKWADALIDQGIEVTTITNAGSGMVGFATSARNLDLVKKLVTKGASVNAAEKGSPTALHMAAQDGNLPMVELLLSLGANPEPPVNVHAQTGWRSPAMLGARSGNLAVLQRLAKAGANLKALDSSGEGLPHYAIRSGKPEVLQWILAQGVPLVEDAEFRNPIKLALSGKKPEMIKALLKLWPVDSSIVAYARSRGIEPTLLRTIIDALGDDRMGRDAKFWDQNALDREQIKLHLDSGGDLNFRGTMTPLQRMARAGNYEGVKLLLERGADPNRCGTDEKRPPMFLINLFAAQSARTGETTTAILRLFLDSGVSANALRKDEEGALCETLLTWAFEMGNVRCVELLLECGANPWIKTTSGDAFEVLQRSTKFHAEMKDLFAKLTKYGSQLPRESQSKSATKSSPRF